jgi:hypothetical protein
MKRIVIFSMGSGVLLDPLVLRRARYRTPAGSAFHKLAGKS